MNPTKVSDLMKAAKEIKRRIGMDFSKSLFILRYRLNGRSVETLIKELIAERIDEANNKGA